MKLLRCSSCCAILFLVAAAAFASALSSQAAEKVLAQHRQQQHRSLQDDAGGNFFFIFDIFFDIFGALGYFFECVLGWTLFFGIFTSPCVCLEAVLRRNIAGAVTNSFVSTIEICQDFEIELTTGEIDITGRNFILACEEQNGDCEISAGSRSRLFSGAPTFAGFFDLVLKEGAASTGALFVLSGGSTTLSRSILRDSVAGGSGGAIAVTGENAIVSVLNSTFINNRAGADGGAVSVTGRDALVQFTGASPSYFVSNTAPAGRGGAVSVAGGGVLNNIITRGTVFVSNSALAAGGAVYLENNEANFIRSTFQGNAAVGGTGGAVALQSALARFQGSSFVGNSATSGGALVVTNSKVDLVPESGSQAGFRDNVAADLVGNDIFITDDGDPTLLIGSNVACEVREVDGTARIIFCNGVANGVTERGVFDNTNCDTTGNNGALPSGNTFCL